MPACAKLDRRLPTFSLQPNQPAKHTRSRVAMPPKMAFCLTVFPRQAIVLPNEITEYKQFGRVRPYCLRASAHRCPGHDTFHPAQACLPQQATTKRVCRNGEGPHRPFATQGKQRVLVLPNTAGAFRGLRAASAFPGWEALFAGNSLLPAESGVHAQRRVLILVLARGTGQGPP